LGGCVTTNSTNTTFCLYTSNRNFSQAEAACQATGGHLAVFINGMEQQEVEQYFVTTGQLLPNWHKFYWMGYQSANWPVFQSIDKTINTTYSNWGE
jgi:hypothetical protein